MQIKFNHLVANAAIIHVADGNEREVLRSIQPRDGDVTDVPPNHPRHVIVTDKRAKSKGASVEWVVCDHTRLSLCWLLTHGRERTTMHEHLAEL